ncbi:hypothetical protein ACHAW6_014496 [Cyclotella cf. meneghiniana]
MSSGTGAKVRSTRSKQSVASQFSDSMGPSRIELEKSRHDKDSSGNKELPRRGTPGRFRDHSRMESALVPAQHNKQRQQSGPLSVLEDFVMERDNPCTRDIPPWQTYGTGVVSPARWPPIQRFRRKETLLSLVTQKMCGG